MTAELMPPLSLVLPRESNAAADSGDDYGFLVVFTFALLCPLADERGCLSVRANPRRRSTRMRQQNEVFDEELSGHYRDCRKASSRCLTDARGREQKAQRGQEHADSQRAAH